MKKYTMRCQYCGAKLTKYEWVLKLLLIFTDTYIQNCPVCHKQTRWLHIFHLRHDSTNSKEKNFNRRPLFDGRL